MIYIASPYSHPDPAVMQQRFEAVRDYTIQQTNLGQTVFSPIVYGHELAKVGNLGTCHEFWLEFNEHMLAGSRSMTVLMLDGWDASRGVQHELEFAARLSIPTYMEPIQ